MITAALSSYQAFQYSYQTVDEISRTFTQHSSDCFALSLKVGELFFRVLSLIPLFIFDLLMIPTSHIYTKFFESTQEASRDRLSVIHSILRAEIFDVPGDILTDAHVQALNEKPDSEIRNKLDFMKKSVENGLKIIPRDLRKTYLELIANDGVLDEGEPPVEIFSWIAKCVFVHYMRLRAHYDIAPNIFPCHEDTTLISYFDALRVSAIRFWQLPHKGRAGVTYKLLYHEQSLNQSDQETSLIQEVNAKAMDLIQNGEYIDQFLRPFLESFKNLIEESGILEQ